jgi:Flp pilus assembly protein TadG
MRMLRFLRELARCTSGSAVLEGALVVPVAILLMAGGVEFGRLFSAYGTANKSMRDAARYLARVPDKDAGGNLTSAYICGWGLTNAKNLAMYGKLNPNVAVDSPLIPGWTDANTVTLQSPACGVALVEPVIIDLRGAVPYSGFMFNVVGLSNAWTLSVQHQEPSIGE